MNLILSFAATFSNGGCSLKAATFRSKREKIKSLSVNKHVKKRGSTVLFFGNVSLELFWSIFDIVSQSREMFSPVSNKRNLSNLLGKGVGILLEVIAVTRQILAKQHGAKTKAWAKTQVDLF